MLSSKLRNLYSLSDYKRDAREIIYERLIGPTQPTPIPAPASATDDKGEKILDPVYAAKWSAIARKRKCGLLIVILYSVAKRHHIDMTSTLAKRILEGWLGHSMSNAVLVQVFSTSGRTAATKSDDWQDVIRIINLYKHHVIQALKNDKKKIKKIKQDLWAEIMK